MSKLQILEELPSPLQRRAKIFCRKLPEDFFIQRTVPFHQSRNEMHTQGLSRRVPNIERVSETRGANSRTGPLTSRLANDEPAMDLLKGVIATSREMKRMIRRHSLEMKK